MLVIKSARIIRKLRVLCKSFPILIILCLCNPLYAKADQTCANWPKWFYPVCHRLYQTWTEGHNELYFSGYAWHNRYTYSPAKIKTYNELAWGGGLGKGFYDEEGDWHGLALIAFLDSHKNLEPAGGYVFLKTAHLNENTRLGLGYAVLITARPDIFHGRPFPGILPWATFNYRHATLAATYIPGARGAGNVLYLLLKWTF